MSTTAGDEKRALPYVYRNEGYTGWLDKLAVAMGALNLDAASAFITFATAPENAAMITNHARKPDSITGSEVFAMVYPCHRPGNPPARGCAGTRIPPDLLALCARLDQHGLDQADDLKELSWQS